MKRNEFVAACRYDNLGRAFILGSKQEDGEIVSNSKLNYETISRTTTSHTIYVFKDINDI